MPPDLEAIRDLWWQQLPLARMLWLAALPLAGAVLASLAQLLGRPDRKTAPVREAGATAEPLPGARASSLATWPRRLWIAAWMGVGYHLVLGRASLLDDAFISFRYALNFAQGHGLVFNLGERVEGYTNFLWTLVLALLYRLTPFDIPWIALALCLLVFGLELLVVAHLGRRLTAGVADREALSRWHLSRSGWHLPLAMPLLAVHGVYVSYGTTGLETGAASLLVTLGALFLLTRRDAAGAALCGTMLILATLTRPDHGLFYAVGGLVVLVDRAPSLWSARRGGPKGLWRQGGSALAAYAAPFAGYACYLLWKLTYYGDVLPNTYYAKSADLAWWDQGERYAATFYLGTQDALALVACLLWLLLPSPHEGARRFKLFTAASFAAFNLYVARIGGDFMYGRFYVSLVPLYLLGAEAAVAQLARLGSWRRITAGATLGLLLASTQEVTLIPPREVRWGIADESTYYPIESFRPLRIGNRHQQDGLFFGRVLKDRGLEVVLGTGGPGTVGYYSRLEVVDVRGLTDAFVARQPLPRRFRPGHEKYAPPEYLLERGVHLLRAHARQGRFHPRRYRRLSSVELGEDGPRNRWFLAHYDRELMRRIRAEAPELGFLDFEDYLDRYVEGLPQRRPIYVRRDLEWMRRYYFDHNDDPERLAPIEARASWRSR